MYFIDMVKFSRINRLCDNDETSCYSKSYLKEYFIENYPIIFIIDDMFKKHDLSMSLIVKYIITSNYSQTRSDIILVSIVIDHSHNQFDYIIMIRDDGIILRLYNRKNRYEMISDLVVLSNLIKTSYFQYSDPNFENHIIKSIKQYA